VPTYQYACTECGDRLEVVQSFSDDPLTICSGCGGRLRKVFSPVGIVFKGSGFYRTDSRNGSAGAGVNGKSAANGSGGGPAASAEAAGGGSSAGGSSANGSSASGSGASGTSGAGSPGAAASGAGSKVA